MYFIKRSSLFLIIFFTFTLNIKGQSTFDTTNFWNILNYRSISHGHKSKRTLDYLDNIKDSIDRTKNPIEWLGYRILYLKYLNEKNDIFDDAIFEPLMKEESELKGIELQVFRCYLNLWLSDYLKNHGLKNIFLIGKLIDSMNKSIEEDTALTQNADLATLYMLFTYKTNFENKTIYDFLLNQNIKSIEQYIQSENNFKPLSDDVIKFLLLSDEEFIQQPFVHKNLYINALVNIYKKQIIWNIKANNRVKKEQANLKRLIFIKNLFVKNTQEAFLQKALNKYIKNVKDYECKSIAYYLKIESIFRQGGKNIKKAHKECETAIQKYENTIGANYCIDLKNQIEKKQKLILAYTRIISSNSFSKYKIWYQNVQEATITIYRDDNSIENIEKNTDYHKIDHELDKWLENNKPYLQWNVKLKNNKDYLEHSTEIRFPKMEIGKYRLIITPKEIKMNSNHIKNASLLHVTDISVLANSYEYYEKKEYDLSNIESNGFFIVDKKSGKPIGNAQVRLSNYYNTIKDSIAYSNQMGYIDLRNLNDFNEYSIKFNNDSITLRDATFFDFQHTKSYDEFRDNNDNDKYYIQSKKNKYLPGDTMIFGVVNVSYDYYLNPKMLEIKMDSIDLYGTKQHLKLPIFLKLLNKDSLNYEAKIVLPTTVKPDIYYFFENYFNIDTIDKEPIIKTPKFETENVKVRLKGEKGDKLQIKIKESKEISNVILSIDNCYTKLEQKSIAVSKKHTEEIEIKDSVRSRIVIQLSYIYKDQYFEEVQIVDINPDLNVENVNKNYIIDFPKRFSINQYQPKDNYVNNYYQNYVLNKYDINDFNSYPILNDFNLFSKIRGCPSYGGFTLPSKNEKLKNFDLLQVKILKNQQN